MDANEWRRCARAWKRAAKGWRRKCDVKWLTEWQYVISKYSELRAENERLRKALEMRGKALQAIMGIAATCIGHTALKDLEHIERIARDALKGPDND